MVGDAFVVEVKKIVIRGDKSVRAGALLKLVRIVKKLPVGFPKGKVR